MELVRSAELLGHTGMATDTPRSTRRCEQDDSIPHQLAVVLESSKLFIREIRVARIELQSVQYC